MGEPMWRLGTSISFLAEQVFAEGRESQVEVVVADWGSEIPISEVIELTPKAVELTKFIHIRPDLAQALQQDSPFAEVYALNAAAKRSQGLFIGRIDQDTLVTADFIKDFFDAYEKRREFGFDLNNSYMFAARKQLPYSFVEKKPGLGDLASSIKHFAKWTFSEELKFCHWASPVGILMMHRNMWDDVGGYDERLIYYWFMDVDLGTRLIRKYPIVNIGQVFGYHFFHLEHIRPGFKFRHSHRKLNPEWSKSFDKPVLNPNGKGWGLANEKLPINTVLSSAAVEATYQEEILLNRAYWWVLFCQTIVISLRRWGYYKLKYGWYVLKKILNKPQL